MSYFFGVLILYDPAEVIPVNEYRSWFLEVVEELANLGAVLVEPKHLEALAKLVNLYGLSHVSIKICKDKIDLVFKSHVFEIFAR